MNVAESAVAIIGAGLAGSEAALVLASKEIKVILYEMRPIRMTQAHTTGYPAELVCSNSLKSDREPSCHGLLKAELQLLKSPLLAAAYKTSVPAGTSLAVDRILFSKEVDACLRSHPNITLVRKEITEPPGDVSFCLLASGPLTSDSLTSWIRNRFSQQSLWFYDAIAPIIVTESIDFSKAFYASRRDPGNADYCNCPFSKEEYDIFYEALTGAAVVNPRPFEEERFFDACQPIETIAKTGYKSLLFGPLRPIGLIDPRTGRRPHAVCQLRAENRAGDCMNMVGFQSRMTINEQRRVMRLIPGLCNAEFLRFGSIHRNTYLNSPFLLSKDLSFIEEPNIFCAGQLAGNEGYTESIATGHLCALFMWSRITGIPLTPPPPETASGSLLKHITANDPKHGFCPTNINYGLIEPLDPGEKGRISRERKQELLYKRAIAAMKVWMATVQ